jgi:hypothetical protein
MNRVPRYARGVDREAALSMTSEEAVDAWTDYVTKQH